MNPDFFRIRKRRVAGAAVPESEPKPPRYKLRWYQYSLRSLLIFVTLCAFACSWFAVKRQQAERQRRAIDALHQLDDYESESGVFIAYDCQYDSNLPPFLNTGVRGAPLFRKMLGDDFFNDVAWVNLSNTKASDATLLHLNAFPKLRSLSLERTHVTDFGLSHLSQLSCLEQLTLRGSPIGGDGLDHLRPLTKLAQLDLSETRITDEGLRHLDGFNGLEVLELDRTRITDNGLRHLSGLVNLQYLLLRDTAVTDAGLQQLAAMSQLKEVYLSETKVTPGGVEKFKRALPNCKTMR